MLFRSMQDEAVTIFYSTHITSDLEKACDFLVYIKDGKIIMNVEKDHLLNEYCIVKGPKAVFGNEVRGELIGLRFSSFGGEALVGSRQIAEALFGTEVKYSVPTIEEIMVFMAKKRER